jgi:hypothetical protein
LSNLGWAASLHTGTANHVAIFGSGGAASSEAQLAVSRGGTGVATAAANRFFAGPATGADAAPTWRAPVAADIAGLVFGVAAGTAGAPGLQFSADTDNGIYRIGTNNWGFAANGEGIADFTSAFLRIAAGKNLLLSSTSKLGIISTAPKTALDFGDWSAGTAISWDFSNNIFSSYGAAALVLGANIRGSLVADSYLAGATGTYGAAMIRVGPLDGTASAGLIRFYVDAAAAKTLGDAFTPTLIADLTTTAFRLAAGKILAVDHIAQMTGAHTVVFDSDITYTATKTANTFLAGPASGAAAAPAFRVIAAADTNTVDGLTSYLLLSDTADTTFTAKDYMFPRVVPSTLDAYAVLLLHTKGADGSTTFSDSGTAGSVPHTVTAGGNAQIDTALASPFGDNNGVLQLDGTDWLACGNSTDWEIGSGDFTLEAWVYCTNKTKTYASGLISKGTAGNVGNEGYSLQLSPTGVPSYHQDAAAAATVQAGSAITENAWTHIAVTRSGNTFRLFVAGVKVDEQTSTKAINAGGNLNIGSQWYAPGNADRSLTGYMKEIRVSKGTARWTATFTPPTAEYDPTIVAATLTLQTLISGGAASVDNQIARFDGTSGCWLQGSGGPTISDAGVLAVDHIAELTGSHGCVFDHILGIPSGTVSAPGLQFSADIQNGIYRIGANNWGMSAAGALVADVNTAGLNLASGMVLKVNATQVVGAQGAAVADATDAASVILRLNDLLARLRTHGLIAT